MIDVEAYEQAEERRLDERRRALALQVALVPRPCPFCYELCNQVEAAGVAPAELDVLGSNHAYWCPHCGHRLVIIEPFTRNPAGIYFWRRCRPWRRRPVAGGE